MNSAIDSISFAYRGAAPAAISEAEIKTYIQSVGFLEDVLHFSRTAFLVVEFDKWSYLYASSNTHEVLGWQPELFLEGGPVFGLKRLHPDDLAVQGKIHPIMLDFFASLPEQQKKRYKFSFTSRLFHESGKQVMLLQNNFFLKWDEMGKPLIKLITFTDITAYKKDTNVVFYVTHMKDDGNNEVIMQKSFPESECTALSKRELEIVHHVSEGLSSQEIACALDISEYTVKVHKKNILKKMGCSNTAQMTALAHFYGLCRSSTLLRKQS